MGRRELENVLRDSPACGWHTLGFHHGVDTRFAWIALVPPTGPRRCWESPLVQPRQTATAVPCAVHVCALYDLHEFPLRDVPDFDEARVENEDIGGMERHAFSGALPLDDTDLTVRRIAMPINVHSKFYN